MQELKYQLEKEDYFDWIHWNVGRQNLGKMKKITAIIYGVFLVIYLGSSIASKADPVSLISTILFVAALGGFMFYIVSAKHQERVIWKRSGLKKLEKTVGFPFVNLTVREDGITMEVPGQVCKDYPYTELSGLEETERLFLLGASDKTWQFVAKSAFESPEKLDEFKVFVTEKIEDAKEHPEKYRKADETESGDNLERAGTDGYFENAGSVSYEEESIEPIDTSSMGKIGKMAHIMAALAAESAKDEDAAEDGKRDAAADEELVRGQAADEGTVNGDSADEGTTKEDAAKDDAMIGDSINEDTSGR